MSASSNAPETLAATTQAASELDEHFDRLIESWLLGQYGPLKKLELQSDYKDGLGHLLIAQARYVLEHQCSKLTRLEQGVRYTSEHLDHTPDT